MTQRVGAVAKLWCYPVKSMRGEECEQVEFDARGVTGDRVYAVYDAQRRLGSGKTTRRFRQIDGLLDFRAAYRAGIPEITFPDGKRMLGSDPQIHATLSDVLRTPVTLAREDDIPHLDCGPVHLVTTAALAWLRATLPDARLDERRFRPNLVIDAPGNTQVERGWLGKTLCIGATVRLLVSEPTQRCRMTTLAQSDLPSDPRVLASIIRDADLVFGMYADVVAPGTIARDDCCTLLA
jgi:MOSC domain-containing protein